MQLGAANDSEALKGLSGRRTLRAQADQPTVVWETGRDALIRKRNLLYCMIRAKTFCGTRVQKVHQRLTAGPLTTVSAE